MTKLKLNDSDSIDVINVFLNETQHPTAFANKLKCLMDGAGFTEENARAEISTYPIELELYYEVGAGLMAVEQGAVEAGTIYSPYSKELYQDDDYVDPPTPEELKKFYSDWGQTHSEICSCLGYDEHTSDDLLTDDYFWEEEAQLWCNKSPDGTDRDDEIVEYLRF